MTIAIRERRYASGEVRLQADIAGVTAVGVPFRKRLQVPPEVKGKANALRWAEEQRRRLERGEHAATRREAMRAEREVQRAEEERAAAAAVMATTVSQAAAWWLADGEAARHSPTTLALRRRLVAVYLGPTVGDRPIRELGDDDVQRLRRTLATCSANFARTVVQALRGILKAAARRGVVCPVVIELPRAPRVDEPRAYDVGHFERIVNAAREVGPRHLAVVLLCGEAGLRRGEVLGLTVADATAGAESGVLLVARTRVRIDSAALVVKSTKTGKARRVPLSVRCREALRALVATCEGEGAAWLLLGGNGDRPACEGTVAELLFTVQRRAGVDEVGPHALRHTAATHMLAAGSSPRAVQAVMGHDSLTTTVRYLHALPDEVARAGERVERWRAEEAAVTSPSLAPRRKPQGRTKAAK